MLDAFEAKRKRPVRQSSKLKSGRSAKAILSEWRSRTARLIGSRASRPKARRVAGFGTSQQCGCTHVRDHGGSWEVRGSFSPLAFSVCPLC